MTPLVLMIILSPVLGAVCGAVWAGVNIWRDENSLSSIDDMLLNAIAPVPFLPPATEQVEQLEAANL